MPPAKSEQQRKWAFGAKGEKWARKHHMDNAGKLPEKKSKKKKRKRGGNAAAAVFRKQRS